MMNTKKSKTQQESKLNWTLPTTLISTALTSTKAVQPSTFTLIPPTQISNGFLNQQTMTQFKPSNSVVQIPTIQSSSNVSLQNNFQSNVKTQNVSKEEMKLNFTVAPIVKYEEKNGDLKSFILGFFFFLTILEQKKLLEQYGLILIEFNETWILENIRFNSFKSCKMQQRFQIIQYSNTK